MIHIYILIAFFIDISGDGHFEHSARAWTSAGACQEYAQGYVAEKAPLVMDIWAQCIVVPGEVA